MSPAPPRVDRLPSAQSKTSADLGSCRKACIHDKNTNKESTMRAKQYQRG